MQISDRELSAMTGELGELHRASLGAFTGALAGYAETLQTVLHHAAHAAHVEATRRNFLRGGLVTAGALGGGAIVAACGDSTTGGPAAGTAAGSAPAGADVGIARLSASLEVLAVNTYGAVLGAVTSGAFGRVPAAVGAFVATVKEQHTEHQQAWNSILTKSGQAEVNDPDPTLNATVQTALRAVTGVPALASLALMLETVALQTYVSGSGALQSPDARLVALTIAPVEAQHAAILSFILGQYPIPDTTIPRDRARTPSDLQSPSASGSAAAH